MDTDNSLAIRNKLTKTEYYILYVIIYSFIGWLFETAYAVYELGTFVNRGFLYGPFCPIYGFGALIFLIFLSKYKNNSFNIFFLSALIFSIFEYLVGFTLDALFAIKLWDYSTEFFNLNGRISILFSFVWGIFGLIFINHIHPFIKKQIDKLLLKIPYIFQKFLLISLCISLFVDTILSIIKYLN